MKCPYCGEEMQKGYVPTDRIPAQWLPEGEEESSLLRYKHSNARTKIIYEGSHQGIQATADYCKSCGTVLLKEER